mmetsp:Transcript_530/g.570  ORF Transcript_530/g.570 Transcript_530/m.570 type:complete len:84 (+) Transcript_530:277-528(+)
MIGHQQPFDHFGVTGMRTTGINNRHFGQKHTSIPRHVRQSIHRCNRSLTGQRASNNTSGFELSRSLRTCISYRRVRIRAPRKH